MNSLTPLLEVTIKIRPKCKKKSRAKTGTFITWFIYIRYIDVIQGSTGTGTCPKTDKKLNRWNSSYNYERF